MKYSVSCLKHEIIIYENFREEIYSQTGVELALKQLVRYSDIVDKMADVK